MQRFEVDVSKEEFDKLSETAQRMNRSVAELATWTDPDSIDVTTDSSELSFTLR